MAWTYTYDIATPEGSDDPAEADDRVREIKAAVQERLNVEHVFDLTGTEVSDADTGKHTDITCTSIVNAGALANTGNLTLNTDKFTIDAETGNVVVAGTLDVAGAAEITGIATLGDGSLLKTAAAPTTDAMLANKKYVDDQDSADHPTYSGGESHTDGSGLITKMGSKSFSGGSDSVTFGTAFPNACISVSLTVYDVSGGGDHDINLSSAPSKTGFSYKSSSASSITSIYWIAIGY